MDTFEQLKRFDAFLDVTGRSPATRSAYRYALTRTIADVMRPLDELTQDDIVELLARLPARGSTRTDSIRALRSYYEWRGLDVMARIKTPRRKYAPRSALSRAQVDEVLETLGRRDPRRRHAAALMYATGTRVGALVAATPDDVDLEGSWITWTTTKGSRPYRSPLGPLGLEAVHGLLELPPTSLGTLVGVGRAAVESWLRHASQELGYRVHAHALRHAAATHWAEAGVAPDVLMHLLNHADLGMVARYVSTSDDRLRAAVARSATA